MAHASRNVRKLRRVRRERTLAYRLADFLQNERNVARQVGTILSENLKEASLRIRDLEAQLAPKEFTPLESAETVLATPCNDLEVNTTAAIQEAIDTGVEPKE